MKAKYVWKTLIILIAFLGWGSLGQPSLMAVEIEDCKPFRFEVNAFGCTLKEAQDNLEAEIVRIAGFICCDLRCPPEHPVCVLLGVPVKERRSCRRSVVIDCPNNRGWECRRFVTFNCTCTCVPGGGGGGNGEF